MKYKNCRFNCLLLVLIVTTCSAEGRRPAFSLSVGTQSIGVRYQFTDKSALVESAEGILELGSDTLKIALTPKYPDDYRMERDQEINSIMDLVRRKESFHQVMDMPFRNLMLWVYPFADRKSAFHTGEIPEEEAKGIYQEMYDFTSHLLTRYSGTGKSFFIGNWEGDWHVLKEVFDYNLDPEEKSIAGAIQWFRIREKAIADARRNTPHDNVEVYFYIELNHVRKSMEDGRPTIVNRVLPHIKTDYVSWSSYDVTQKAAEVGGEKGKKMVFDALDFIERHLPESDIPGKRVFIGEYGFKLAWVKDPEIQCKYAADIMRWGLEWGCPFILYWELYCNEIDKATGEHRGFWLIDDKGDKQPVWYRHRDFLTRAAAWVDACVKQQGELPSQADFNAEAVRWMESLPPPDVHFKN